MKPTHYGWFLFAPVLFADIGEYGAQLESRAWCPDFVLELALLLFYVYTIIVFILTGIDEPDIPILLTGEIE